MKQQLLVHLNVVHGAIWASLARKGLGTLTLYDGAVTYSALWANFAACLILGAASRVNKTPFVVGLTTGFCGTLSSFSSVILELFYKAANVSVGVTYNYPNAGYGVMQFISVILIEFGVSILGFHMGKHLSLRLPTKTPNFLDIVGGVMGVMTFIVVVVLLGVLQSWRLWMFTAFFAPFGAIVRYHLSKLNSKTFPLGTFIANLAGTTLIAVFVVLSRGKLGDHNLVTKRISCQTLLGLEDGLCGSLTTVSTFVAELFTLSTVKIYSYGVISIGASFSILLLILGSYNWTHGLNDPICT